MWAHRVSAQVVECQHVQKPGADKFVVAMHDDEAAVKPAARKPGSVCVEAQKNRVAKLYRNLGGGRVTSRVTSGQTNDQYSPDHAKQARSRPP
eukprot:2948641-Prymnesium_polylepis.3